MTYNMHLDEEFVSTDLVGKTVREVMTHRDEDGAESLINSVFESIKFEKDKYIDLSFVLPEGDEERDIESWDACQVEVSIWKRDRKNPDEATGIAEVRLGPYPLDTLASPLAEEARAHIPIAKAQLSVLPDQALQMYHALRRATKELNAALRYVDEALEKAAEPVKLRETHQRSAAAARAAIEKKAASMGMNKAESPQKRRNKKGDE